MRERAAAMIETHVVETQFDGSRVVVPSPIAREDQHNRSLSKAIRALPTDFTDAELLAAAMQLPEVRALVEALKAIESWDAARRYPLPYRWPRPIDRRHRTFQEGGGMMMPKPYQICGDAPLMDLDECNQWTARQIIEARLGRPLGPLATMPRDLRRALYLLALRLVK
jgi:hypothetical protein